MIKVTCSSEDLEWLARNIYFEARSENILGRMAVAFVTMNRATHPRARWGKSITSVVTQRLQFSWYNNRVVPEIKNQNLYKEIKSLAKQCVEIYNNMSDAGYELDGIVQGADHYYATWIAPPNWIASMKFVCQIGVHKFYKA